MKNLTVLIGIALLLSLSGCDLLLSGCGKGSSTTETLGSTKEDSAGNLVVINGSGKRLVLFDGETYVRTITSSSSDFLIEIPNPYWSKKDLRLFKETDASNLQFPGLDKVFKHWEIVLANDNDVEHRVTWFVQPETKTSEYAYGDLTFAYVGGTENSVDVFLNGRTGAKVISLSPGTQNIKVGIEYGNYTVHYRYWKFDQNTTVGSVEVGWTDKEIVVGKEVDIFIVLNASRLSRHLQVPLYQSDNPIESQYGKVSITNNSAKPVQIYSDQILIENIMYTDGSKDNASAIIAGQITEFILPSGTYTLLAKDITSAAEVATKKVTIESEKTVSWTIN